MDSSEFRKYEQLKEVIHPLRRVVVAFSGGVDSLLLLHASVDELGSENVKAVIGVAPTLPLEELRCAEELAGKMGVQLQAIETNVMETEEFVENPPKRCYHCRTNLSSVLSGIVSKGDEGAIIVDGANTDDLKDYRPGLKAADEHGVRHPLIEAGIRKIDVRRILELLGYPIEVYAKPAAPCLSSRIPYGEVINVTKLKRIEQAEDYLKNQGFLEVRVRHVTTPLGPTASIEIGNDTMSKLLEIKVKEKVISYLRSLGFARIWLNLEGFRSGNLNDALTLNDSELDSIDDDMAIDTVDDRDFEFQLNEGKMENETIIDGLGKWKSGDGE